MKKYAIRTVCFALSLGIGIGLAEGRKRVFLSANSKCSEKAEIKIEKSPTGMTKIGSGLEIKFKEAAETEDGTVYYFEISNNDNVAYTYRSYSQNDSGEEIVLLTELKLDGKKIDDWKCGTGLIDYKLRPGEKKTFKYHIANLSYQWKNEGEFSLGVYLKKDSTDAYQVYWSGNLPITESLAAKLRKEKAKYN